MSNPSASETETKISGICDHDQYAKFVTAPMAGGGAHVTLIITVPKKMMIVFSAKFDNTYDFIGIEVNVDCGKSFCIHSDAEQPYHEYTPMYEHLKSQNDIGQYIRGVNWEIERRTLMSSTMCKVWLMEDATDDKYFRIEYAYGDQTRLYQINWSRRKFLIDNKTELVKLAADMGLGCSQKSRWWPTLSIRTVMNLDTREARFEHTPFKTNSLTAYQPEKKP